MKNWKNASEMLVVYFLEGFFFFLRPFIKFDYFLFKLVVLLLLPFLCIFLDIGAFAKKLLVTFFYKRSLYILSNRKFGLDYFWNRLSHYIFSFSPGAESLQVITTPQYRFHRRISAIKNFYDTIKNYEEKLLPIFSYMVPLFLLKVFILPLQSVYLWFIIPHKELRLRYKQQSYLYRFFITFMERFEFKDENMHPKYKTAFPFLYMAGLDFYVELIDIAEDEDDIEDRMFLELLSLRKMGAGALFAIL
jgi:hypothetical protein